MAESRSNETPPNGTSGGSPAGSSPWEKVVQGVAAETGEQFFAALVRGLSESLSVDGAWVTEYEAEANRLRALAFWFRDDYVAEYVYEVAGTPCEPVLCTEELVHFPDRVVELFPEDPDLAPLQAVSYMGQRLVDVDGTILGHLAVLDSKSLPADERTVALFRVFAARAGAELQRLAAEADVREREERLRRLIDHAMDGIVELDDELSVTMMNPAAGALFGCDPEGARGDSVARFLTAASLETLRRIVERIEDDRSGERSSWIPSGLRARTLVGGEFGAEATVSRSVAKGCSSYTLILRNADAKREAERRVAELQAEAAALREEVRALQGSGEIVGQSAVMRRMLEEVEQVAPTDSTVLILGETGTGKELVARTVHRSSARTERPLVTVNCAAIPANLIESELFGHEKGAFTGATRERRGRFALADGGTLFLDEIGELPTELQSKLLRVLQERRFEPVGSSRSRSVDVRVLVATHRDLSAAVEEGAFRADLYYRLNVFPIRLPPLRTRGRDVVLLAESFRERFARRLGRSVGAIDEPQAERLLAYDWPGNVRELQNVIERAVITATGGRLNLSRALPEVAPRAAEKSERAAAGQTVLTAAELGRLERENIARALELCDGKVSGPGGAAELLGMHPSTLTSRVKALGVKS